MKLEFGTGSRFALLKDKNAFQIIDFAIKNGIFRFDTAVNYGNWKTQPLLGRGLEKYLYEDREKFVISSKAGSHNIN